MIPQTGKWLRPAPPLWLKRKRDCRRNQITFRSVTGPARNAELIVRMRFLFAERFQATQARGPTFLNGLAAARQRQRTGRYVFGDDRSRTDIGALAYFHRR